MLFEAITCPHDIRAMVIAICYIYHLLSYSWRTNNLTKEKVRLSTIVDLNNSCSENKRSHC